MATRISRCLDDRPRVGVGPVSFADRMYVLDRCRALDMEPEEYERARRGWHRFFTHETDAWSVPRVWDEESGDD